MTQEEKDLLLKDLCVRLPYGVKIYLDDFPNATLVGVVNGGIILHCDKHDYTYDTPWNIGYIKPYLFPLSSMTEEQKEELYKIGWYLDEDKIYSCFRNYDDVNYKTHIDCFELINWCYKNNFDINGLIPMGLAKDATGLNIY